MALKDAMEYAAKKVVESNETNKKMKQKMAEEQKKELGESNSSQ